MSAAPNPDHLALLKFGLALPPQQREEVIKLIKSNPAYKEDFEKIKNSLNTMLNEDDFLEVPQLPCRPSPAPTPKSQRSQKTTKSSSSEKAPFRSEP